VSNSGRVEGLKKENIIAAVSKALNKEDSGAFITFQIQGTFDTELLSKDFTPIEDISTFKKTFGK